MRYISCPMSQNAATLHQFSFSMSNRNYRPPSRRDAQLNNHYTFNQKLTSIIKDSF